MKILTAIMLTAISFVTANNMKVRASGAKYFAQYPYKTFYPDQFKEYLKRIYSHKRLSRVPISKSNQIQRNDGGIIENDCDWFQQYYGDPAFWTMADYVQVFTVPTEWGAGNLPICHSMTNKCLPIVECDLPTSAGYSVQLDFVTVAVRPSATAGCQILDVNVKLRTPPEDAAGDCYLALINGLITLSCPPNEYPPEFRVLSLFSAGKSDTHTGFKICADRNVNRCEAGSAKVVWSDYQEIGNENYIGCVYGVTQTAGIQLVK